MRRPRRSRVTSSTRREGAASPNRRVLRSNSCTRFRGERERLRYESRMSIIAKLCAQRNWRAALDLLKDAVIGREGEPKHLALHAEILIGLHKIERVAELVSQLESCEGRSQRVELLQTRWKALEYFMGEGGELYSAYGFLEKGDLDRARQVASSLVEADASCQAGHFILAIAAHRSGDSGQAAKFETRALKVKATRNAWIATLLKHERTRNEA